MGKRINGRTEHYWYKAFLLGLFFSAAFFIPYIVVGHGYFLYYGDFNVQQVPFYQMIHDAIRAGKLQWSTTTDLGSSLVGSYTFYILGSPFFWITLPFPSKVVPYLMGPLPAEPQAVRAIETGDILLFGDDCVVVFYDSFTTPYSYTRIGKITDPQGLREALGEGTAAVAFALP